MRLNLFPSGLIDEISCDADQVKIKREGLTKYKFSILKSEKIEFELWTTKKGKIEFDLDFSESSNNWLNAVFKGSELESLIVEKCSFHFEQCDRGLYSITFSNLENVVRGLISTNGYIKTKLSDINAKNS